MLSEIFFKTGSKKIKKNKKAKTQPLKSVPSGRIDTLSEGRVSAGIGL
jgi:hypothetical protein